MRIFDYLVIFLYTSKRDEIIHLNVESNEFGMVNRGGNFLQSPKIMGTT